MKESPRQCNAGQTAGPKAAEKLLPLFCQELRWTAGSAIFGKGERSLLVFLALVWGLFVLIFALRELGA